MIRIACDQPRGRRSAARRSRDALKAHVLIQMDVELVPSAQPKHGRRSNDAGARPATSRDSRGPPASPIAPFYRPDVQTMPRERLAALQLERLQTLLARIWERPVPFFRRKLEAAGLTPRDVRSLDDLRAIPTTVKDDLRASEAEHPPLGDYRGSTLDDCVRIGCSTGTSGKPTIIFWTRHDQAIDLEAVCRGRWRWGLRPGSSLAHGHPFGLYGGGISFSKGIEALGLLNVALRPAQRPPWTREVVRLLATVVPEHYRFFGNAGAQYADAARAAGYDPERDLNLRVQGEDPKEQYKSVSAGLEALGMLGTACDGGRRRARRRGSRHRRGDRPPQRAPGRRRRARQPGGHRAREGQRLPALRPAGRRAPEPEAVSVRRDPQAAVLRRARQRHRRGRRPRDAADRRAAGAARLRRRCAAQRSSTRSCAGRGLRALPLRVEHVAAGGSDDARRSPPSIAERVRARLGVPVDVELLAPNALPRFAFKAARVVDEEDCVTSDQ